MNTLIALLTIAGSAQAFTMPSGPRTTFISNHVAVPKKSSVLKMSSVDDEVAALRAAAQKAREDAQKLAKVRLQ